MQTSKQLVLTDFTHNVEGEVTGPDRHIDGTVLCLIAELLHSGLGLGGNARFVTVRD
jgi:hypothetical protein